MSAHRRLEFVTLIFGMLALAALNRALVLLAGSRISPSVPSALFLAYLLGQIGLVAAWAVMADRVFWAARVVVVLVAGLAILWPYRAWSSGRDVEIVFACHFTQVVIALAMLRRAGFRLSRNGFAAANWFKASQFSLKKLLLFISLVAVLMAFVRAESALQYYAPIIVPLVELNVLAGIFAVLTLAAIVGVLVPKRPLLWGLLACLLSALVGVGNMLLRGKYEAPYMILFAGPGLMQIAVMCVVRRLGWRLRHCPLGPLSPDVAHSPEPVAIGSLPTS